MCPKTGGGLGFELGFKLGLRFKLGSGVNVSVCTPQDWEGKGKESQLRMEAFAGEGGWDGKSGQGRRGGGERARDEGGKEGGRERGRERGGCGMLAGSMQCREGHYTDGKDVS